MNGKPTTYMNLNVSVTLIGGQHYEINGLNIWDLKWQLTGQRIRIKELGYGRQLDMPVYEVTNDEVTAIFAADEVSNNVYLIYHEY